ncbi:tetratricopeptide repeat protein [Prosthecobacter sp.]|uniref:tetratricopeptide repeat protein n=1 Tax=Prosthecobacter sp. TaxID=1965333 RepID=UPI003784ED0B
MLTPPADKKKLDSWVNIMAHRPGQSRLIYDWLKAEIKPTAEYAAHAHLMASFARALKLPEEELATAEQMDLQLNKDDPEAWLRRAISYARVGKEGWAVDLFLEALRRTNLADTPAFTWALAPPQAGWLERVTAAGRMDDLASSLGAALQNTPANTAQNIAADMVRMFIPREDNPANLARLNRLLQVLLQHQRHLLLACFDSLSDAAATAERAGHSDTATLLARMALRGIWPKNINQPGNEAFANPDGMPHGVNKALTAWGGSLDDVGPDASIMALFRLALRGDDAQEFVDDLVHDARLFPKDEQLVSCALMAQALRGSLPPTAFALADKLDDAAQMRAAWRLCMLAQPSNISLKALAPFMARGLGAVFQDKRYLENGQRHFLIGTRVLPWLEKAGAKDEILGLLPLLVKSISGEYTFIFLGYYAVLAAKYEAADMMPGIVEKWQAQCAHVLKEGHESQGWLNGNLIWLCRTIRYADSASVTALAALAADIWDASLKRKSAVWDPLAESAGWLSDSLLAAGDLDRLKSQAADVARILSLGGEPGFATMASRIQKSIEFLDPTEERLPTPHVWVEYLPGDGRPTRVHWRAAFDLSGSALNLRDYPGSPVGTEVVPRFMHEPFELQIFAGTFPDTLHPLLAVTGLSGSIECKDLPAAGWISAVLRSPRTGAVHWGRPVRFSLHPPVIDSQKPVAAPAPPPLLDHQQVASLAFPITSWFLAETFPRAALCGRGHLVVFDTSKTPWVERLHLADPQITERDRVFMLDPDAVRLFQPQPQSQTPEGRIFLVPCGTQPPARLQDCAQAKVPFVAANVELSPDGSAVVFMSLLSSTGYHKPFQMGVAWMDGSESFETAVFQTSVKLRRALPYVASWSSPDTAVIDSCGAFCQLHRTADGLEIKPLSEAPAAVPPSMSPWHLKYPDLLVRRDVSTGSLLHAYKLRQKTIGTPMGWKTPGHPVILQTARHDLISVLPAPSE